MHKEQGFTLIEVLLAAAALVVFLTTVVFGFATIARNVRHTMAYGAASNSAGNLIDAMERDSRSAQAIFVPGQDVGNKSNADQHEVDFYARDATGIGHFWAYCYAASANDCSAAQPAGTIERYRYKWSELPANGGAGATADGAPLPGFTGFQAQTLTVSQLLSTQSNPLTAAYFTAVGVSNPASVTVKTGYPGVLAGNLVTAVTVITIAGTRVVHLLAGTIATSQVITTGLFTPPPFPFTSDASSVHAFRSPIDTPWSVGFTEQNYGSKQNVTPAQIYKLTSAQCPNASAPATAAPTNPQTGAATVTVSPTIAVLPSGAPQCTLTYSDNSGSQSQFLSFTIGPTFVGTATDADNGVYTFTIASPGTPPSPTTDTITVSEENYFIGDGATASSPGFTVASVKATPSGTCSIGSPGSPSFVDTNYVYSVTFPLTLADPNGSNAGTSNAVAGSCIIDFQDDYGRTIPITISVFENPFWLLGVTQPPASSVAYGGSTSLTAATSPANGSALNPSVGLTYPAIATSGDTCAISPAGFQPSPETVTISMGTSPGACNVVVSASQNPPPSVTYVVDFLASPPPVPPPPSSPPSAPVANTPQAAAFILILNCPACGTSSLLQNTAFYSDIATAGFWPASDNSTPLVEDVVFLMPDGTTVDGSFSSISQTEPTGVNVAGTACDFANAGLDTYWSINPPAGNLIQNNNTGSWPASYQYDQGSGPTVTFTNISANSNVPLVTQVQNAYLTLKNQMPATPHASVGLQVMPCAENGATPSPAPNVPVLAAFIVTDCPAVTTGCTASAGPPGTAPFLMAMGWYESTEFIPATPIYQYADGTVYDPDASSGVPDTTSVVPNVAGTTCDFSNAALTSYWKSVYNLRSTSQISLWGSNVAAQGVLTYEMSQAGNTGYGPTNQYQVRPEYMSITCQ